MDAPHRLDEQQHASKRRKSDGNTTSSPTAAASGGGDWIDQALAVGEKSSGDDDSATAEELAKRARDEVGRETLCLPPSLIRCRG